MKNDGRPLWSCHVSHHTVVWQFNQIAFDVCTAHEYLNDIESILIKSQCLHCSWTILKMSSLQLKMKITFCKPLFPWPSASRKWESETEWASRGFVTIIPGSSQPEQPILKHTLYVLRRKFTTDTMKIKVTEGLNFEGPKQDGVQVLAQFPIVDEVWADGVCGQHWP